MKAVSTKKTLLASVFAMLLCVSMFVGSTFAWFTSTATTSVNAIKAGNLKVDIVDENGDSIQSAGLEFVSADGVTKGEAILWEPNATYKTTGFKIANAGSLALKYKLALNGVNGDAELIDVIEFSVIKADGTAVDLETFEGHLTAESASEVLYIKGHMKADAGNECQGKTITGLGITVYATQDTVESDSDGDQYDVNAKYPVAIGELKKAYAADASVVPDGFVVTAYHNGTFDSNNGNTGTVTIKDVESLLYFAYVLDPAAALANEPASVWQHTSVWYGGSFDRHIVLDADIDLQGLVLPNGFGNMKNFAFDGKGHTIKNATINYTGTENAGLFVGGNRGISNLIVENIKVVAPNGTGNAVGIVSSDANALIDKVTVRNSSVIGGKYTGAVVGYNYGSVTNCVVENCTVSGRYKVGGIVGYICNSNDLHTFVTGNSLAGVTVKGENLVNGKSDFVIGKIVGNWNATVGTCNNNTFSGTTTATDDIGETESRCTVTR